MSQQEQRLRLLECCLKEYRPRRMKPSARNIVGAVVVAIRNREDSLELLFIKRTERAEDPWSGQVAFPGGRWHAQDKSSLETALREAKEEVGIDLLRNGRILGSLSDARSLLKNVIVTPYVAWVPNTIEIEPNDEVAEYFWAPIKDLRRVSRFPVASQRGVALKKAYVFEEHVIWGLTARIIDDLLKCMKSIKLA